MKAYVFPGQGAQFVGMGKDLYERFPKVSSVILTARTAFKLSADE